MKKLSIFAALLLVFGFTSCTDIDNATGNDVDDGKMTITLDDVMYKVDLVGTFAGEVGQEVSLKLGVYDAYDIYGVDFGDGVIHSDTVCYQNGGLLGDDGMTKPGTKHTSATEFKGTVAGDGIVKVYGNSDVWYANLSGGLVPTALSSEKLTKIVQLLISGVEVDELDLKDLAVLKLFSFTQGSVTSVNLADNPELTSLTINNNSASKFESKLASLDVSKNAKLEYLNVYGASAEKPGLLTTLDLSNNPALTNFYAQYNKLTSVKFADGAKLSFLNVQNNELAEMDLSSVASVKDIYASDNKLTAIDLSKVAAKATLNLFNNELTELTVPADVKTIDAKNNKIAKVAIKNVTSKLALENNKLTFSNLPTVPEALATKTNKYTYAPQDTVLAVKLDFQVLDLTGEYGPFQGITDAKDKKTAVTFKAGEVDVPAENYEAKDGKVTFFHVYDKINGVLTNEAFPGLTLTTKEFAIKTYGTDVEEDEGTAFFTFADGAFTGGSAEVPAESANAVAAEIKVASKKAAIETDYVLIKLDKALAKDDVIKITGYRKKDNDAVGTLYILFETGEAIDEGDVNVWNNIHENYGQTPNTNSYKVNANAAGSKTIKLARSKASTNVFIQKIEILRK